MRFSTREDCLVPVPRSLAHASDGTPLARARQPALCFASISDALQQVQQDRSPWAQDGHSAAAQAEGIVEPKTGLTYQPEYCQRGRSQCGQLAGVGCAPQTADLVLKVEGSVGIAPITAHAAQATLAGNGNPVHICA